MFGRREEARSCVSAKKMKTDQDDQDGEEAGDAPGAAGGAAPARRPRAVARGSPRGAGA